jgi:hypothetical protein
MENKQKLQNLHLRRAEGSFLVNSAVTSHLLALGYPEKSYNSLMKCGTSTGYKALVSCSCQSQVVDLTHRCNLRSCPRCSVSRKRRFVRRFLPTFGKIATNRTFFFYSLTLAPQNYKDLDYGIDQVQKSFAKFLRQKYIKQRIKAGLYVIEAKGGEGNWNVHIHAIVYGRWLDNRLRGNCIDCGQHLIKYDKIGLKYYCANRKCNSLNVSVKTNTKVASCFQKASGVPSRAFITRQNSTHGTLNYMLKHIGANKDDFSSTLDHAKFIVATKPRRLVHTFGLFYGLKFKPAPFMCSGCGEKKHICLDQETIYSLEMERSEPPNPQYTII